MTASLLTLSLAAMRAWRVAEQQGRTELAAMLWALGEQLSGLIAQSLRNDVKQPWSLAAKCSS